MVLFARRGGLIVVLCAFFSAIPFMAGGCASVPTFPVPPSDAGPHCSNADPCPSGQTCLQGACYAMCDMTHPCGTREVCTNGMCVGRMVPDAGPSPHDGGNDAGPCLALNCMSPTPVCNAEVGRCTECSATSHDECGAATTVCDVGRGTCTAFGSAICSPCNVNADCATGMMCVTRVAPEANERVCLPACGTGATCTSPGFACGTDNTCVPFIAASCTAYRAGVAHQLCTADTDCPQLGATIDNGLISASGTTHGMCFEDTTTPGAMTCHIRCGLPGDCPTGQTCTANWCQ